MLVNILCCSSVSTLVYASPFNTARGAQPRACLQRGQGSSSASIAESGCDRQTQRQTDRRTDGQGRL